ncbi:aminopeptidase [Pseudoalteromonas rubra]|uniref:Aminopeptidase n=1 Tax=Pseudoalteromonas rubra TaxID=43658 RepID=A0A5S3WU30_9GAMM|nr:M28 family metallopeptidase [Pseudoalteromonas rubra]TMP31794.1 aminopeptidase [Pseudoalteromonas rubra]TMP33123.1 aminopeptidase [Pseudoalteromonas rubra]
MTTQRPVRILSLVLAANFTLFSQGAAFANTPSGAENPWITIDTMAGQHYQLQNLLTGRHIEAEASTVPGISIAQINDIEHGELSHFMHENYHRCGGFVAHASKYEALQYLADLQGALNSQPLQAYTIDNPTMVNAMIAEVSTSSLDSTVANLTSFHNRYYTQQTGVDAAQWIKQNWQTIAQSRSDISVDYYTHNWSQSSVVATINGAENANEIVIIGGHLDSINQSSPLAGRAPGADDNASGIAVLTEALKALVASGYKPQRTIQIMGFAAEEVGLRGSKAIAQDYKSQGKNVVGMVQFDMTGNHGSSQDIVMMTDYTNSGQNQFLAQLLDAYLPTLSYGYDQCGYGCSDHASWFAQGFAASMPFESRMSEINRKIHTINDTVFDATHASKFAKLAVAYLAEMGKNAGDLPPPDPGKLQNGVPKTGISGAAKSQHDFSLEVPAVSSNLVFKTSGGSGDADLYVKYGSRPTLQSYDCKSTTSSSNETCNMSSANEGTYYVMVEAWNEIQNVTLVGEYQQGGGTPTPVNRTESSLSVGQGQWINFTQQLGSGYQTLTVTLSGGVGDGDLYVKFGTQVSDNSYDCRPYKNGNSETCTFSTPNTGTWYIGVRGYQSASGMTLSISAQ